MTRILVVTTDATIPVCLHDALAEVPHALDCWYAPDAVAFQAGLAQAAAYDIAVLPPVIDGLNPWDVPMPVAGHTPTLCVVLGSRPAPDTLLAAHRSGIFDWADPALPGDLAAVIDRTLQHAESIRQRLRAEDTLRENEERYRVVSRLVSDYVYSVRVDSPLEVSNPDLIEHTFEWAAGAFEKVTGYTFDDMRSMNWIHLLHPEDLPNAMAFAETLNKGERAEVEYRIRRKDGAIRWLHDTCQPVWDPECGRICRLLGGVSDITDRKAAEAALRESRVLLHSVYRVQSSYIEHADNTVVFTELITALLALARCEIAIVIESPGEQVGRGAGLTAYWMRRPQIGTATQATCQPLDRRSQLAKLYTELYARHTFICNGGTRIEGEAIDGLDLRNLGNFLAAPLVRAGHTHGLVVLAERAEGFQEGLQHLLRPILTTCGAILAARRQSRLREEAEAAMRENEARWRFAIEGSDDGVWDFNIEREQVFYSAVWKRMLGYAEHEISEHGREWWSRIHPDDLEQALDSLGRFLRSEVPFLEVEYRMRHKDGSYRWIHDRGMIMERAPDGRPLRAVGTHRDVTRVYEAEAERRSMEAQVLQAQKLESMGVLAGGLAHDFNNILTSVIGYTDLALTEVPQESLLRRRLEQVLLSARRAADLTRQLLAYSGKGQFILQTMDLGELVRETCVIIHVSLSAKTRLVQAPAANLPGVTGDVTQVRQIILNLLTNAAEAIGEAPGEIVVSTGAGPFRRDDFQVLHAPEGNALKGNFVFLDVSDNGTGITPEILARICDPFFSTKFAGRGLGLATVLGILRGHGGALLVRSIPGKGTTLRALFPASSEPVQLRPNSTPPPSNWRGEGLALVIDDEEAVRAIATAFFRVLGFRVIEAASGEEGLEVFAQHAKDIQLVLLDMSMPGKDGAETFADLQAQRPDLRVLMSSGYDEQMAIQRLKGQGIAGFLQKPYLLDDFTRAVRAALDHAPTPAFDQNAPVASPA